MDYYKNNFSILYLHTTPLDSKKANIIQVVSMCNAMANNGIDVELALPETNIRKEEASNYIFNSYGIEMNFKVLFFKRRYKNSTLNKYFSKDSIKKILDCSDANYVFTRMPNFLQLIINSGKKLIFESHNNILHNRIAIIDRYWKYKIKQLIIDKNFVLFICISQNLGYFWLENLIPKEKMLVLHDGFISNHFEKKISKSIAREKIGINHDEVIIMYVGSLYPDREINLILNAADKYPKISFYIVGGPEENVNKLKKVNDKLKLKNVEFFGRVEHKKIPLYLFSADILLGIWSKKVPTINFCSPLKIFEYMASGKTIITHDFPPIKEVLEDHKDCLYIDPEKDDDLVLKIKTALENLDTETYGVNARKKAFENYSWDARAKIISERLKLRA